MEILVYREPCSHGNPPIDNPALALPIKPMVTPTHFIDPLLDNPCTPHPHTEAFFYFFGACHIGSMKNVDLANVLGQHYKLWHLFPRQICALF